MIRNRLAAALFAAFALATLACSSNLPSALRILTINVVLGSPTLTVGQTSTATVVLTLTVSDSTGGRVGGRVDSSQGAPEDPLGSRVGSPDSGGVGGATTRGVEGDSAADGCGDSRVTHT